MLSIPLVSVNLVATSSQVEILPMEEEHVQEHVQEQAYPLIEAMQEGGAPHNDVQEDEEVQEMVTFQPNSQDQQFIEKL